MAEVKYKRILLKISGEALAGEAHRGLDFTVINSVCDVIRQCRELGVQVGALLRGASCVLLVVEALVLVVNRLGDARL